MNFINIGTFIGMMAVVVIAYALLPGKAKLGAIIGGVIGFGLLAAILQPATQTALANAAGSMITGLFSALAPTK